MAQDAFQLQCSSSFPLSQCQFYQKDLQELKIYINRFRRKMNIGLSRITWGFHQTLHPPPNIAFLHYPQGSGQKKQLWSTVSMDEGVLLFTKKEVLLFIPKPRAELFVLSCQKPVNLHRTLFMPRVVCHLTAQIIRKAQGLCSVDIF